MAQLSASGYFYPSGVEKPLLGYKLTKLAAQGNLPPGSTDMSGAVYWLNDVKCPVVYGPTGWVRISTGSI
jgi:hypothetical protein